MNNNSYGYPQQNRSRQMYNRESNREIIRENDRSCNCCNGTVRSAFPECPVEGMAYVPFQQRGETYSCEKALSRGTLFPCLDKPFTMGCCR